MHYEVQRLARENIYDSPYYEKSPVRIFSDAYDQLKIYSSLAKTF